MDLPKRKLIRLKNYDYSQNGMYFITICTKDRKEILWATDVGDGVLDVPDITSDKIYRTSDGQICNNRVLLCCAYDIGNVFLSEYGVAIQNQITDMNKIYTDFKIIHYVIMPNHIHFILKINNVENDLLNGTSRTPSPTKASVPKIISTFKRFVNKNFGYNIFQRSYYDHIIRNEREYESISKYIYENPAKWEKDCYYTSKDKNTETNY